MMRRSAAWFALSLLALLALAPVTRHAVPPATELAKAERDVRATFKNEYAKAQRSATDREALGRKLLEQAAQNENEPALEYVLLREARDLAASVGDTKTIIAAAEKMAEAYDISRPADLLPGFQAALKAPLPPAAAIDMAETCLTAGDDAIAADDYDTAGRCTAVAEQAAKQARDAGLFSRVSEHLATVRALRASHQRAVAALQKLKTDQNNPSLNLVAGRFYCLDKGDWERGLPLLARGTDVELRNLALNDLDRPATAAEQSALGDHYWDAAGHVSATAKKMLQARARYWYGKAFPNLQELTRARVEERLFTPEVKKLHDMIRPGDTKFGRCRTASRLPAKDRSSRPANCGFPSGLTSSQK